MVSVALIALALGQVADAAPLVPGCELVAPNGNSIAFRVVSGDPSARDEMWIVGEEGTVWPTRTLVGQRTRPGSNSFLFGGAQGLIVQIGEVEGGVRSASVRRREGDRVGLPLAYGYCRERPRLNIYRAHDDTIGEDEIAADIPAFDPRRWPANDCGLILSDGRRMRFGFRLDTNGAVRLSSPGLWSGRAVSLPIRWENRPRVQYGTFGRRDGPSGSQRMYIASDNASGVKLITLSNLGDASAAGQIGFAICGYRQLVRTAVQEL
jgi:hypothetical protein